MTLFLKPVTYVRHKINNVPLLLQNLGSWLKLYTCPRFALIANKLTLIYSPCHKILCLVQTLCLKLTARFFLWLTKGVWVRVENKRVNLISIPDNSAFSSRTQNTTVTLIIKLHLGCNEFAKIYNDTYNCWTNNKESNSKECPGPEFICCLEPTLLSEKAK